jgi:nucleotide-binding universal stress UspA family protein
VVEWPSALDDLNRETSELAKRNVDAAALQLAKGGFATSVTVRRGDAADQLIAVADANDADLIVLGSRGLGTWSRLLLGSVARKVVQHARQSVLVIRQPANVAGATEDTRMERVATSV